MKLRQITAFTLIALSFYGCKKESSTTTPPPPTANFSFTGAGLAPSTVSFTNTTLNGTIYSWDFGDGGTSTATNPTHTYLQGGVFTVTLIADNGHGNNVISKTVNITTPTSVKITSLTLTKMPFSDPACSCGWDASSGADVYFTLYDNAGTALVNGGVNSDVMVTGSLPLTWTFTPSYQTTNFTSNYRIKIFDKDTNDVPPSPDDLIGDITFKFSSFSSIGYPTTIVLPNSTNSVILQLNVQWQ